jgi:hypothetical protein
MLPMLYTGILAIFCCQDASRPSSKFWQYRRLFVVSDSAGVEGMAIGLAPCECKRFSGRYRAGLWHLAQNARALECSGP